ncbi:MAG: ANL family adenylate-forming protein [Xanthobacteraceae bacterium]
MQPAKSPSLRALLSAQQLRPDAAVSDAHDLIALDDALAGTWIRHEPGDLAGRSILLATPDQLSTALALIELDGIASRLILCAGDVDPKYFGEIAATGAADTVIHGADATTVAPLGLAMVEASRRLAPLARRSTATRRTEWILLTSGTTGAPKLVRHDLASLIAPIRASARSPGDTVWATFYDIRRYGGLQIFLRAMLGGSSMILSSAGEAMDSHLQRLGRRGVTHISGTPSHWRRVLMSGAAQAMSPRYVRLSGEIADQAVLDALHATYPEAAISHAYASTEAGVGFNVIDGREGFPAALVGGQPQDTDVGIKVEDGTLRIRSPRTAFDYLGPGHPAIRAADGFVDTGDLVELRGDRYVFIGRRGGVINVGGQKVHPEEVETTINQHPAVQMSLVRARRNPITGALVVADVVAKPSQAGPLSEAEQSRLAEEILAHCRGALRPYKVPAQIRFVPSLTVAATGKLARLP